MHLDKSNLIKIVKFSSLISIHDLTQKVDFSTNCNGHTFDVKITREYYPSFRHPFCVDLCLSDHKALCFNMITNKPSPIEEAKFITHLNRIDPGEFSKDLPSFCHISSSTEELADSYNIGVPQILISMLLQQKQLWL